MTRILCLWLPNWPIQRAIRARPELKGRPVALVVMRGKTAPGSAGGSSSGSTNRQFKTPGRPGTRQNRLPGARGGCQHTGSGTQTIVAACCGAAAKQGARPGMPLAEAQALMRDLKVAAYDPAADRQALVKLAEACEWFSPRVALEEGDEPESLLLDISNLEHLWGSEDELIRQVKKFFTRRGHRVRIAVAETVGAAWALAHFSNQRAGASSPPTEDSKLQIADSPAPSPQLQVPTQLPIESLRIADDTAALLHELGIETIDQLLLLPRDGLASRFGDELLRRLDQWTGAGREVIEPHRGLAALEASYALEEPTGDRAVLMHVLEQLVNQLARQLAARDQGAVLLVCLLQIANRIGVWEGEAPAEPSSRAQAAQQELRPPTCNHCTVPLRIGLLEPTASARQLLELIELHLETVKLTGEVDRVEIRAAVVDRLGERQRELFADRWPTDPHQLAVLVNRLSSRLGYERVLRAELRTSPVPERAVGWKPVTGLRAQELKRKDKETRRHGDKEKRWKSNSPCLPLSLSPCLPPRPLLLHPQPQPTEVVCVAPDGPPQFVWIEKRRERIASCVGPERIETLWWRGPSVRRDYYRVATESGDHLWMFRRLTDGRWFMHGQFA